MKRTDLDYVLRRKIIVAYVDYVCVKRNPQHRRFYGCHLIEICIIDSGIRCRSLKKLVHGYIYIYLLLFLIIYWRRIEINYYAYSIAIK